MYIEFSKDCKYMTITNRKPQLQAEHGQEAPSSLPEEMVKRMSKKERITYENEMMDADPLFESKLSSASCYVSEIKDLIYGGMSSRFWMLRKHFISMS